MINIEKAISRGQSIRNQGFTYSMGNRWGARQRDCSSFVYDCLSSGGGSKEKYVPSTETLHSYLIKNGFKLIAENKEFPMKRGQVIIWGKRGFSSGENGHTGIALDNQNWLEMTGYVNGVLISNHDYRLAQNGYPYWYVYELTGANTSKFGNGGIKEDGTFTSTSSTPITLRNRASTDGGALGVIKKGQKVKYDSYMIDNKGYVWIRQPRKNGFGYLATGDSKNGKRVSYWGRFS